MLPHSLFDYLLLGGLGPQELIIILVIILVLFGAKKIPNLARSLGKGITEFKAGLHDTSSSEDETKALDRKKDGEPARLEEGESRRKEE